MPAAEQYEAKAAPVFPLEVPRQNFILFCSRSETALAANLSLYEPEGLTISSLKYKFLSPAAGPSLLDLTKGVPPSPIVILQLSSI